MAIKILPQGNGPWLDPEVFVAAAGEGEHAALFDKQLSTYNRLVYLLAHHLQYSTFDLSY